MLKVFEFIFLKVNNWYLKNGENDTPGVYAIGLITLLQSFNILSVIFLVHDFLHIPRIYINKIIAICFFFGLMAINYFYVYKFRKVASIEEEILNYTTGEIKYIRKCVYIYISVTVFLFVLGIFLKGKM